MNFKYITRVICFGATVMTSVPALAQDSGGRALEEVIVTAQKREQSSQDVPIAITTIGAADIERMNATELKDLQFATPNLVIAGTNPVQQVFSIRGISDRGRSPGYDLRAGVYVDGVWVGKSAASNQSAVDIESVEVLRGPQGTLFGKNTVAGAISITTKRPTEVFEGFLQAETGNLGHRRLFGSLNIPFTDTVLGKITVSKEERDGYIRNIAPAGVGNPEYNGRDELATRGQLLWDASDDTSVLFTFDHVENEAAMVAAGVNLDDPIAPDIRETAQDGLSEFGLNGVGGASVTIDHTFANNFTLTSITAYRYEDWFDRNFDEDYTPLPIAQSNILADADHVTQELRLASPANDRFDYVLGVYYLDQTIDGFGDATLNADIAFGGGGILGVTYDTTVDVRSIAAFAHGNYQITDSLQLTAGIRYTNEEKDVDYVITDTTPFFTNGTFVDSRSADDLSPRVSLNWFVTDDVMVYGSYSRGFKSGGWNTDFIADVEGLPFDDEEVDAYEVGVKSTLADNRLRFNVTAFQSEHSDFQVFAQTPLPNGNGSILTVSNAAKLTSKGVEIELQWLPADWLMLWANYGYTDAKFDSYPDCLPGGVDCTGNRPAEAPKVNYNLGAELLFSAGGGEFFVNANYHWRDSYFSSPTNAPEELSEEQSALGARMGWNSPTGRFSVFAWGRNITDEADQIYNSVSFLGIRRGIHTQPRMYGITGRWNFGAN